MVNHDISLSNCLDSPRYYILHGFSTLRGYWVHAKINRRLLTYGWNPKVVIYPYGLGCYWWKLIVISNDLKIGPDQSIEPSIGPWSGLFQLLNRKGLWTGIKPDGPTVEPSNQTNHLVLCEPVNMWIDQNTCGALALQQPSCHQPTKPTSSPPTSQPIEQLTCFLNVWAIYGTHYICEFPMWDLVIKNNKCKCVALWGLKP